MANELVIYGTSTGSVAAAQIGTCTATVAAGQRLRITKAQCTMEGVGYAYIRVDSVDRYAFYFWAAGQQSEDNLSMLIDETEVVSGWIVQAGGVQPTRMSLTGLRELVPV